jgi:parallel beta-helix repeat protein
MRPVTTAAKALSVISSMLIVAAMTAQPASAVTGAARAVLHVPEDFPTIGSAISAARPGDTIAIAEGRYAEQLTIRKDLTIRGSGRDETIIRAPSTLVKSPSTSGRTSIVEIANGATVRISELTVSGPGSGTCASGRLDRGITVVQGARLYLSAAAITHIRNTPFARCIRSGTAVGVGDPGTGTTGHATVTNVTISDYLSGGIMVFNAGSTATISHSVVAGAGRSALLFQSGIELVDGPVATITHNVISGNLCDAVDIGCGPDPISDFQAAGLGLFPAGPGSVISNNTLVSNDIGLYLYGSGPGITVSHNTIVDSRYFGIAIQNGDATVSDDRIVGGRIGVGVIADSANTVGTLRNEKISRTSVAPIKEISCCGFAAKAVIAAR